MRNRIHADDGQTLVYVAISMVVLLGIVALALNVGYLYSERRRMQNAADAGALAGARELCQNVPVATAQAVARDYAVNQNGAAWATPVASGYSMFVTAGEVAHPFFGGVGGIVPSDAQVVNIAQARCVKTSTGCTTWPLTIQQSRFNNIACGDPVYITVDHDDDCPSGCDCSHIFSGVTDPQRGWFVRPSDSCGNGGGTSTLRDALYNKGYSEWQIHTGDCIRGKPGTTTGAFGGATGKDLEDWVAANGGKVTVQLPLFSSWVTGDCGGGGGATCKSYTVGGFGCLDVTGWQKNDVPVPPLPGQSCSLNISKAIVARINCHCTVNCGTGAGDPGPNDARIPVLVQ
jgi:hypothetical protein